MTWQQSIILFFVFSVWQSLERRKFSQTSKLNAKVVSALSYVFAVMPMGIVVGLASRNVSIEWSWGLGFALVSMAFFVGIFNWLAFEASKELSVAIFQTIFQLFAVTAVFGGWLLLGEGLSSRQIAGSILLIGGAVLAAQAHKTNSKKAIVMSAVVLAAVASISLGFGVTAEKAVLSHMTLGAYYIVGYAMQTVATCVIAAKELKKFKMSQMNRAEWKGVLALGGLSAMLGFFYIAALNLADNVALVSVVATFQMPLTALAGYLILKEKEVGWKLALAVIIAFVGLLVAAL